MRTFITFLLLVAFSMPVCSAARRNYSRPHHHARSRARVKQPKTKHAAKRAKKLPAAHRARARRIGKRRLG